MRLFQAIGGVEVGGLHHNGGINSASFSADGQWIVTASGDNSARLWDAMTCRVLVRFEHDDSVCSAALSTDRTRLVTASLDSTVRIWNALNGQELARLDHNGMVGSAAFSPSGDRVVTTSGTGRFGGKTVLIWDIASGIELAELNHDDGVNYTAFSPEGSKVVTASQDNRASLWEVTWAAKLTGERLVRAVARERLKGCGRLSEEELRVLRPILGEVDPEVTLRWLPPSLDDAEIEAILAQWRRHREMVLALAKQD